MMYGPESMEVGGELGIEVFDDAHLGFDPLPNEIKIESEADAARFEAEHGIKLGSFFEEHS